MGLLLARLLSGPPARRSGCDPVLVLEGWPSGRSAFQGATSLRPAIPTAQMAALLPVPATANRCTRPFPSRSGRSPRKRPAKQCRSNAMLAVVTRSLERDLRSPRRPLAGNRRKATRPVAGPTREVSRHDGHAAKCRSIRRETSAEGSRSPISARTHAHSAIFSSGISCSFQQ